jgi:hypothetical protein
MGLIRKLLAHASDRIQAKSREGSATFEQARLLVESLQKAGKLTETQLFEFARAGKFDETVVAISLICDMPFGVIERAVVNEDADQMLVLARSLGLSWETTRAILQVPGGGKGISKQEIGQCQVSFAKLRPETAKKAVQFYRFREKSENGLAE